MVQITSSFVATVLLVAPAVLAAPISQESFEAREPLGASRALSTASRLSTHSRAAVSHSLHEGHRPAAHRSAHESSFGAHRGNGLGHTSRLSSAGSRRPPPLRLGGSRRMGKREETEELELSAREPYSGLGSGRLGSGRLSPSSRLSPSHRLSASHSEGYRHLSEHHTLGRRPSGFGSARLGASRRLGGREDIEEIDAREPFSGLSSGRLGSGRLSPSSRFSPSHRMSASHSLGRRPGFGSARLSASRRLGGREDIEDIDAREPFSGLGSGRLGSGRLSPSSRLSPSHRLSASHSEGHRHSSEHRALGRRPSGFGSARLSASRRLGGREDIEDIEELAAREPLKTPLSAPGRITPALKVKPSVKVSPSVKVASSGLKGLKPPARVHALNALHAHGSNSRVAAHIRPHSGSVKPHTRLAHTGEGRHVAGTHRLSNVHSHSHSHSHSESGHRASSARLATGSKGSRRFATREDLEEFASRDDAEELSARDLEEIDELIARDPGVKEWFENLGRKIKGVFVKKPKAAPAPAAEAETAVAARSEDAEMTDLLQREVDLD